MSLRLDTLYYGAVTRWLRRQRRRRRPGMCARSHSRSAFVVFQLAENSGFMLRRRCTGTKINALSVEQMHRCVTGQGISLDISVSLAELKTSLRLNHSPLYSLLHNGCHTFFMQFGPQSTRKLASEKFPGIKFPCWTINCVLNWVKQKKYENCCTMKFTPAL